MGPLGDSLLILFEPLALAFFVGNTPYFIFSEEPKLEVRFGEDYRLYKFNVRRWVPRLTPWEQNQE